MVTAAQDTPQSQQPAVEEVTTASPRFIPYHKSAQPNYHRIREDGAGTISILLGSCHDLGSAQAIVDAADFELVSKYHWDLHVVKTKSGEAKKYARTSVKKLDGQGFHNIKLHKLLLPDLKECGHLNGKTLDCRRANLFAATRSQIQSGKNSKIGQSGYRGVSFDKQKNRYAACIKINKKKVRIGRFRTAKEAALAFDAKARLLLGPLAKTNFPQPEPQHQEAAA
jgi:AP2 domain